MMYRPYLTAMQKEIVRALADCDLHVKRTADVVNISTTLVYAHVKKIHQKTGLNPRCFWDLIKLLEAIGRYEQD